MILTGFLGAGKTTILNRVLSAQHHRRVAVLVNELGRIDVDAGLIRARAGDVIELVGGCVCHQVGVQRELWTALDDIVRRSRPDAVILETSGIAEPQAILRGLDDHRRALLRSTGNRSYDAAEAGDDAWPDEDDLQEGDHRRERDDRPPDHDDIVSETAVRAAMVITVVDAEAGLRQIDRHAEALEQVVAADRILISKTDVAQAQSLIELHRRLHTLNPGAERAAFPAGGAGTSALIPWLLDVRDLSTRAGSRATVGAAAAPSNRARPHQLVAATFVDDAPLLSEALLLACESFGERLVRVKGFVHLAGESRRGFLERAGNRTTISFGASWDEEPRMTRLVLIGEDLDEAALRRRLWACRAPAPA